MNRLLLFIISALSFLGIFSSCTDDKGASFAQPEFKIEEKKPFVPICELPQGAVYGVSVTKQYVLVFIHDMETKTYCSIFDKHSGDLICRVINEGRGPCELSALHNFSIESNGEVHCRDFNLKKDVFFNPDNIDLSGAPTLSEKAIDVFPFCRGYYQMGDSILHINAYSPGLDYYKDNKSYHRFAVSNNGDIVSFYDETPESDVDKITSMYALNGIYSVSPDRTKMAASSSIGAILELFDTKDLSLKFTGRYISPKFQRSHSGNLEPSDDLVLGFNSLFARNDLLYAVYDGQISFGEYYNSEMGELPIAFNKIDIYDWAGHPVKRIVTDKIVLKICVDDEDQIFAIVADSQFQFYLSRL